MSSWAEPFRERLQLLTDLLPVVAGEPRFALKGGSAINLFEHDLPRLSVDIDLTWLPSGEFADDCTQIASSLEAVAVMLRSAPLRLQVQVSASEGNAPNRLIASRGRARVQIETSPVMRGTVHPVRVMAVRPPPPLLFASFRLTIRPLCKARPDDHPLKPGARRVLSENTYR